MADERRNSQFWRFLSKVSVENFYPGVPLAAPCWRFHGTHSPQGYGQLDKRGAHVVAILAFGGSETPVGYETDHLCRNRGCCNPDHLEAVPRAVNARRGLRPQQMRTNNIQKPQTHCKHGHELTGANVYYRKGRPGARECGVCLTERNRARSGRKAGRR